MNPQVWSAPVKFETAIGYFRIVATTEEASLFLLNHWPIEDGEKYVAARRACMVVLGGARPPDHARAAFIMACEEAGMDVME